MSDETQTKLGAGSWIQVGLLTAIVGTVCAASFWAASLKASVDIAVSAINTQARDVGAIRDSIVELQADLRDVQRDILDRWRFSDEVDVWQQVGKENKGFIVPVLRPSGERRDAQR